MTIMEDDLTPIQYNHIRTKLPQLNGCAFKALLSFSPSNASVTGLSL
jgi:hypothetical protein